MIHEIQCTSLKLLPLIFLVVMSVASSQGIALSGDRNTAEAAVNSMPATVGRNMANVSARNMAEATDYSMTATGGRNMTNASGGSMTGASGAMGAGMGSNSRPNFVVILVDDAGLMDFGGYGGEARTPNINRLADEGVRFSNYHTSPLCAPSRAMLLTGKHNHRTGIGSIPEVRHDTQSDSPAYSQQLHPDSNTIANRLRQAGYATFMTGKWHLGDNPESLPSAQGFDRSFALDASGADNWEDRSYMPYYADAPWYEDGEPAQLPDDFYSSEFIVDKMIQYLDEHFNEAARSAQTPSNTQTTSTSQTASAQQTTGFMQATGNSETVSTQQTTGFMQATGNSQTASTQGAAGNTQAGGTNHKPFLSYLAFQAIHIPVQAPREFTDNYEGVYAAGWDALREQRLSRAKQLGFMPADATPPEPHPALRTWGELSGEEQQHYEKNMMVNAGMLEAMDHHIGRLLDYLEAKGELANTVFIITSDNGPEFNDPNASGLFRLWMSFNDYHTDPERAGGQGYMGAIGPEWASAAAVPGSLFKMYASEGSTRVPLIISGPNTRPANGFNPALTFVTDIAPTIASMAQLPTQGMDGRSLLPVLAGQQLAVHDPDHAQGMEVAGNSALFKGQHKLTRNTLPHGDGVWRLHHLGTDPAERHDLSRDNPELYAELMADYQHFASSLGIIPLPDGFNIQEQILANTQDRFVARNRTSVIVTQIVLLALLAALAYLTYRVVRKLVVR